VASVQALGSASSGAVWLCVALSRLGAAWLLFTRPRDQGSGHTRRVASNSTACRAAVGVALACPAQPTTASPRPATPVAARGRPALTMEIPTPAKAGAVVVTFHHH
jgi:hypothetical protein